MEWARDMCEGQFRKIRVEQGAAPWTTNGTIRVCCNCWKKQLDFYRADCREERWFT